MYNPQFFRTPPVFHLCDGVAGRESGSGLATGHHGQLTHDMVRRDWAAYQGRGEYLIENSFCRILAAFCNSDQTSFTPSPRPVLAQSRCRE